MQRTWWPETGPIIVTGPHSAHTCLCTLVSWSRLFSRKEIFCFCAADPPVSSSSSSFFDCDFLTRDCRSCTKSLRRLCSVCSSLATVSSRPCKDRKKRCLKTLRKKQTKSQNSSHEIQLKMFLKRENNLPMPHCVLVASYGYTDLGQHWLRYWLVAWRHQAITWTSVD